MNHSPQRQLFCWLLCAAALAGASHALTTEAAPRRPNILVILVDDMGYSDLGCYGGEVDTPNLDALAANGIRMTQFYTTPRCCPSRASVLTGLWPHQAGLGAMTNPRRVNGKILPGYQGHISQNSVTLAEAVKPAGYQTYAVGKWHVANRGDSPRHPLQRGFEQFYGFSHGYAQDMWTPQQYQRLPAGSKSLPLSEPFYQTRALTAYALEFLRQARQDDAPFLMYLAYGAPHFPLQAPRQTIDKYTERYAKGWDHIRSQRHRRMKKLGLIAADAPLPPRSKIPDTRYSSDRWRGKQNPAWDSLPADRRTDLTRRMAIFAAMIDEVDQSVGSVVAELRKHGELDDTFLIFFSDNGACFEWEPFGFDGSSGPNNHLHRGAELAGMGQAGTYHSVGSAWANASNTPLRMYKHFAHEGGISTPCIIHYPALSRRRGEIDRRLAGSIDLMPTVLQLVGAEYPRRYRGHAIEPLSGKSLLPVLDASPFDNDPADNRPTEPRTLYWEHFQNRAVRRGDFKAVFDREEARWRLYNIANDRAELHDLSAAMPDRLAALAALWDRWAHQTHVLPNPAPPK